MRTDAVEIELSFEFMLQITVIYYNIKQDNELYNLGISPLSKYAS